MIVTEKKKVNNIQIRNSFSKDSFSTVTLTY